MFQEWYKKANEDIPVNELLKERLKQKARQQRKPALYKKIYPLGAAVAGLMIVAATIWAYPLFTQTQQEPGGDIADPAAIVQNATFVPIASTAPVPAEQPAVSQEPQAVSTEQPVQAARKPLQTQKPAATSRPQYTEQPAQAAGVSSAKPAAPADEEPAAPTAEPEQPGQAQQTDPASEAQDEQTLPEATPKVLGVTSDPDVPLETVVWTRQEYIAYLGIDVEQALDLPEEFADIGAERKSMSVYTDTKLPYFDLWSFKYETPDGRSVTVKTTKINAAPLDTSNRQIAGADVLLTEEEQTLTAEFYYKEIHFTVITTGMPEQELTDICTALLSA